MLPDIGDWTTVREADNYGSQVRLRRDHNRIALERMTGAGFDAAQWAKVNAEAERITAEGRQWLTENCKCGIASGKAAEVVPYACRVHGTPCAGCGQLDGCPDNCTGEPGEAGTVTFSLVGSGATAAGKNTQ